MKNSVLMMTTAVMGLLAGLPAHAGISHCYHWLQTEGNHRLADKYAYAKASSGELQLKDDANAPQDGMYCNENIWSGALYGDRVIRIDLAQDTVFSNGKGNLCGKDDNYFPAAECAKKAADLHFVAKELDWYYIIPGHTAVIRAWTASGPELIQELQAALKAHPELEKNINLAIQNITGEGSQSPAGNFTNSHGRLGIDEQIKDESKWASLGLAHVLERLGSSKTLSDAEKNKIASQVFAKLMANPQFNLNSKETLALVNTSPFAKNAYLNLLLKDEAHWKNFGLTKVLDAVYFSTMPEANRNAAIGKILDQLYPDRQNKSLLTLIKSSPVTSPALSAIYSHQYFSNEANWGTPDNWLNVVNQAASDTNLTKAEQADVYSRVFTKVFADPRYMSPRADLERTVQNPAVHSAYYNAFYVQSQKTSLEGANIQSILDGFYILKKPMSFDVAHGIWYNYLATHAGLKTQRLIATFVALGYQVQ